MPESNPRTKPRNYPHIFDIEKLSLQVIKLDVNNSSTAANAVEKELKNEGLIDLSGNGTGYILPVCFEDFH